MRPTPEDMARAHRARSRQVASSSTNANTARPDRRARFIDTATGELGTIARRSSDRLVLFHPDGGGPPRGVYEPGRYVRR